MMHVIPIKQAADGSIGWDDLEAIRKLVNVVGWDLVRCDRTYSASGLQGYQPLVD